MSATLSRLILSMAVIGAPVALYMPVFMILERPSGWSDDTALLFTDIVCGGLFVAGWILTWRSHIRWTPRRMILTIISLFAALIPSMIVSAAVVAWVTSYKTYSASYTHTILIIWGGMIWAISWLALTALIWRETAAERGERLNQLGIGAIVCPGCGYNLTGLKEARCPECGAQYTLDQLLASALEQHGDLESS